MATPTAGTEVPSKGGGGVFPPFQPETFPGQLLWLAIAFGVLYLVLSRVALPRIGGMLEERRDRIADDLGEAQRLRDKTDAAIATYEKALADARGRAQALGAETRDRLVAEADEARKALEADLARRLAEAEATIGATKDRAMSNVRGIAVDAAGDIVERLVGVRPDQAALDVAVDAALRR